MVKRLQKQLQTISKSLVNLSKKVEKFSADLEKLENKKSAPARKAAPGKKPAATKKAGARKTAAKSAKPAKSPKNAGSADQSSVLDSVYGVIKRSRKGVDIPTLKKKTGLESRQLSNALYKLSKRGVIEAQSRGTYVKK